MREQRKRGTMKTIGSMIVKAFMWVFGLALIVYGANLLISSSREWSAAQAEVMSSLKRYTSSDEADSYSITYKYQVNGSEYTDSISSSRDYSPGDIFTVYFDPSSPGVSFESQGGASLLGFGSCLFGIICVGSMAWGVWKSQSRKKMAN
jgi:hypothetical protein